MAWGDKIDQFNIQKGETVTASIDLESREYNGRWYTDVKAWKISRDVANVSDTQSYNDQESFETASMSGSTIEHDDIPF